MDLTDPELTEKKVAELYESVEVGPPVGGDREAFLCLFGVFLFLSSFLRCAARFFATSGALLTSRGLQKTPEIIPSDVTEFFLRKSGFACEDPVVIKMVSLAAQKFVTDLAKVGLVRVRRTNVQKNLDQNDTHSR